MRAGILGPREVFFFVPEGLSRRPCYSSELLELTVILSHLCCLFILPQAEADATYGALWPWGWRVWAWLRPIFSEPLFLMAMRLTGRGMSSTNFSKSLFAVFRCQRHEPKSWHESNSRHEFHQLQERIVQAKGYLFYFFVEVMPWVHLMAWS